MTTATTNGTAPPRKATLSYDYYREACDQARDLAERASAMLAKKGRSTNGCVYLEDVVAVVTLYAHLARAIRGGLG